MASEMPVRAGMETTFEEAQRGEAPPGARESVHEHPIRAAILGAVAFVAAVCAFVSWLHSRRFENTDDAQIDAAISAVSPRVAGTVIAVHVADNQRVNAGDLIAEIDARDLDVALTQARAALMQAEAELAAAKLNVPVTEVTAELAAREARVQLHFAAVEVARARLERAVLDRSYARIVAPVGGIIGKKGINVGDYVQPGQSIVALTQTDHVWVTANFRETQLEKVRPGQRTKVHVDAIDRDFLGEVESVPGATATGNDVSALRRWPVRIKLYENQPDFARLRPGMSVEPKVALK